MIDLSVIIVSWNVLGLLTKCLDSLLTSPVNINSPQANGQPTIEILVVDSASQDATVATLQTRYPQVRLLAQTENVGFTKGNNIGLAQAEGRHLFLLNPDTEVHGDALVQMIRYLDEHPQVGIVGPHTLNTDGTTQSSRRHFPTRTIAFFESTPLQKFAPQALMDEFYVTQAPDDAVLPVDWVQGSALLARREVYAQIGGLDEGYIMFSEELDWCKRAKTAGWGVVYLGTAQITHHGGKSTEQVQDFKHIYFQESKLRYYRKYYGRPFAEVLRLFLLATYVWQLSEEALKGLLGHKREMRQKRVQVYWHVLKSGLKVS